MVNVMIVMPVIFVITVNVLDHDRSRGRHAGPLRRLEGQRVVVQVETAHDLRDFDLCLHLISCCIDERCEHHVARHSGRAVEPGDATRIATHDIARTMRAAAQAAPYPLSMPTTDTPLAHVACIASNAVTPSSPDP